MKTFITLVTFIMIFSNVSLADKDCADFIESQNTKLSRETIEKNYCETSRGDCVRLCYGLGKGSIAATEIAEKYCNLKAKASCITDQMKNSPFSCVYLAQSYCANPNDDGNEDGAAPGKSEARRPAHVRSSDFMTGGFR
jgi:hypothetical protein